MFKYIKLFIFYFRLHIKSMILYRGDFLFALFSDVVWGMAGLLMMAGIFGNGSGIGSYTYEEVAFMYAYSLASLGIYYLFFRNVSNIPETYIYEGNLDRLMIRPINMYFQIILEKFFVDKGGDFIVGVVLIMIYGQQINISWDMKAIAWCIALLFCSAVIYLEINSIYSVISFWIEDRHGMTNGLDSFRIFVKYPIDMYHGILKWILTFLLPYAFTAYYLALVFLRGRKDYILLTIIVCSVGALILPVLWAKGLKRYSSIGN